MDESSAEQNENFTAPTGKSLSVYKFESWWEIRFYPSIYFLSLSKSIKELHENVFFLKYYFFFGFFAK